MHLVRVARDDDDELVAVVLHALEERIDGLVAKVLLAAVGQGVGFVYKQDAVQRLVNDGVRLHSRLANVLRNELRPVGFDKFRRLRDPQRLVCAGHEPGDGRLARAWAPREDAMVGRRGDRQTGRLPLVLQLEIVDELANLLLDRRDSDQLVQLCKHVFYLHGRLDLAFVARSLLRANRKLRQICDYDFLQSGRVRRIESVCLADKRLLVEVSRIAPVAEVLVLVLHGVFHTFQHRRFNPRRKCVLFGLCERLEYLCQLLAVVVGEIDVAGKAGFQPRIHLEELLHRLGVPGNDDNQPVAVVLHALEESVDRLLAEVVFSALGKSVCLVDEQDAVQCAVNDLVGLDGRLPDELCDKPRTVGLHQLVRFYHVKLLENASDDPGDSRLACSRVTREHAVVGHAKWLESTCSAGLLHLDELHHALDLGLYRGKANH